MLRCSVRRDLLAKTALDDGSLYGTAAWSKSTSMHNRTIHTYLREYGRVLAHHLACFCAVGFVQRLVDPPVFIEPHTGHSETTDAPERIDTAAIG